MNIRPLPPYFIVKLPRKKVDKVGSIYIPQTAQYMAFNLQCGEIVAIGSRAAKQIPQARVGHTLIIHHFVEANNEQDAKEDHLIHQTETDNYYAVTAVPDHNGKTCEAYGIWDGDRIIPNKEYVFFYPNVTVSKNVTPDNIEQSVENGTLEVTESGLITFKQWEEKREDTEAKMDFIKKEIQDLSKSGVTKPHIKQGIAEKESEMNKMSAAINKRKYIPLKIAFYNDELLVDFPDKSLTLDGGSAYVMNFAASTEVTFMDKTYIIAQSKYVGAVALGKNLSFRLNFDGQPN